MTEETRSATLHDILFEGQHCVTFRQICGNTETQSLHCYPTKIQDLRAISFSKYHDVWKKLAMQ